jgi:hypothetical protein
MEVTLRKAYQIEKLLERKAAEVQITTSATLSIYDDKDEASVKAALADAQAKMIESQTEKLALVEAINTLHNARGEANERAGIPDLLRQSESLRKMETIYGTIGKDVTAQDVKIIVRQLEAAEKRASQPATDRYSRAPESLSVALVDEATAEATAKSLNDIRRQKVAIADQIEIINGSTRIVIPAFVAALVEKYSLL